MFLQIRAVRSIRKQIKDGRQGRVMTGSLLTANQPLVMPTGPRQALIPGLLLLIPPDPRPPKPQDLQQLIPPDLQPVHRVLIKVQWRRQVKAVIEVQHVQATIGIIQFHHPNHLLLRKIKRAAAKQEEGNKFFNL